MRHTALLSCLLSRLTRMLLLVLAASFALSGCLSPSAPSGEDASGTRGTVRSGTFDLEYVIEGSGPPIVVVGFPTYYRRIFSESLRSHFRMIFVDHRVSAASPGEVDPSEADFDKLVGDIERVRQALDLGRIAVMGHSGHAYMALEYAKAHSDNVSHVVMIGAPADFAKAQDFGRASWQSLATPARIQALQESRAGITDAELAQLSPSDRMHRTYVRDGPFVWYDYTFDSTHLWEGVEVNVPLWEHVWNGELVRLDVAHSLDDLHGRDIPVLVMVGLYDFIAPASSWDPILAKYDNFTIRVFEQSGHTPPYEQPEEFERELLAWIGEHAAR